VKSIGSSCFASSSIRTVHFEKVSKIEALGSLCFSRRSVKEVSLPDGLVVLRESLFEFCAFNKIDLSASSVHEIEGWCFTNCSGAEIVLPRRLSRLGEFCFMRSRLGRLGLGKCAELRAIPLSCFHYLQVKYLIVPRAVRLLSQAAFACCSI
jgi:hypothetical protein